MGNFEASANLKKTTTEVRGAPCKDVYRVELGRFGWRTGKCRTVDPKKKAGGTSEAKRWEEEELRSSRDQDKTGQDRTRRDESKSNRGWTQGQIFSTKQTAAQVEVKAVRQPGAGAGAARASDLLRQKVWEIWVLIGLASGRTWRRLYMAAILYPSTREYVACITIRGRRTGPNVGRAGEEVPV